MQCDPGDLFVVRNVANIVPPYEKDEAHHGTSAALEFGVCFLHIEHLILLGHSQCGGIEALIEGRDTNHNDFITNWVSIIQSHQHGIENSDEYAKLALHKSYDNCMGFPWIAQRVQAGKLAVHLWFFDIKTGEIFTYSDTKKAFRPLDEGESR